MSDTDINQYYPQDEVPPVTLTAGEAPEDAPATTKEPKPNTEVVSATEAVEDLVIDFPDIPLPDDEPIEDAIKDTFDDAAFNFAVVGVGQGGSRLAESFWNLGYRRVGVINTAQQDLSLIKIPESNKLLIGDGGAGKNPDAADEVFRTRYEDILDFLKKTFGAGYERVLVCAGAGGGTGGARCGVGAAWSVHKLRRSIK